MLRNAILKSEKSRYAIAHETGVSAGVLCRFVNGERSITIDTADKICHALGLTMQATKRSKA
jgi:plasmid maintenance system antidote protein VapI